MKRKPGFKLGEFNISIEACQPEFSLDENIGKIKKFEKLEK